MLPRDHDPGSLEFWLEPPLLLSIYLGAKEIASRLDTRALRKLAEEVREALVAAGKVFKLRESPSLNAYAIDSSYSTPPMELIGGVLSVLSYGYVGSINGVYDRHVTGEVVLEDLGDFEKIISRRAQLRERELATRLLMDKLRGRRPVDLLIIDGELTIHPLPYNLPVEGGSLAQVARVLDKLFTLASTTGTTLAGVVKRVRSRYTSIFIGKCVPVNDKLLMSLVLKGGEAAILGKYSEILPKWIEVNYRDCELARRCRGDCGELVARMESRLREGLENLTKVFGGMGYPGLSLIKEIKVAFYRPSNGMPAVKVEVLDLGKVGVEEALAYLEAQTTETGYPFLLDRVDEYVRVDPRVMDYVRSLIIRGIGEVDEVALRMLEPTNPQKAYLVRRLDA